jgi:hypothetical protein
MEKIVTKRVNLETVSKKQSYSEVSFKWEMSDNLF